MVNNEAQAATVFVLSSNLVRTASLNGSWVDIGEYEGDILLVMPVGTVSGTSPTLAVKLEDADDSSGTNSADLAGAAFSTQTTGPLVKQLAFSANSSRRWVRVVSTLGGTTPSFTYGVYGIARKKIV